MSSDRRAISVPSTRENFLSSGDAKFAAIHNGGAKPASAGPVSSAEAAHPDHDIKCGCDFDSAPRTRKNSRNHNLPLG